MESIAKEIIFRNILIIVLSTLLAFKLKSRTVYLTTGILIIAIVADIVRRWN